MRSNNLDCNVHDKLIFLRENRHENIHLTEKKKIRMVETNVPVKRKMYLPIVNFHLDHYWVSNDIDVYNSNMIDHVLHRLDDDSEENQW